MVEELNDTSFDVSIGKGVSLVDFWAPWCGPCKMLSPVIDELAGEMSGKLKFYKVNVDGQTATAEKFGISSIPALLLFKDGKLIAQKTGMSPKKMIQDWIESSLK